MIKTNLDNLQSRRDRYKQVHTLLSHGFSHPTAWPNGQITIFPWDSAVDEWLVETSRKSPGDDSRILWKLVERLCSLNGATIDDFVVGELNTVLMLARAIQHDNTVQYVAICSNCGAKEEHQIKIPDDLGKIGEKSADYPGYDLVTLPKSKDIVKLRPLLVRDEKAIEARVREKRTAISDRVQHILVPILEVGGGKPETLDELFTWYDALHPQDARVLENKINELTPHLDTELPHVCDACKREFTFTLVLDRSFFRGSSPGKPGNEVENLV